MDAESYNHNLDQSLRNEGTVDQALYFKLCDAHGYGAATAMHWLETKLRILKLRLEAGHALHLYNFDAKAIDEVHSMAEYEAWVKTNFRGVDP